MYNEEDRKWLYEQMQGAGVDTGSYDDFKNSLNNDEDRKWYYDQSVEMGLGIGSEDDFYSMMVDDGSAGKQSSADNAGVATETQPTEQKKPYKTLFDMQGEGRVGEDGKTIKMHNQDVNFNNLMTRWGVPGQKKQMSQKEASQKYMGASGAAKKAEESFWSGAKGRVPNYFTDVVPENKAVEAADRERKVVRDEYDAQNFEGFYQQNVKPVFEAEKAAGKKRASANDAFRNMALRAAGNDRETALAMAAMKEVDVERETDPKKIAENTIKAVEQGRVDEYVLGRMGFDDSAPTNEQESAPLSDEEKLLFYQLYGKEIGEVTDLMMQRMYREYQEAGAPKKDLDYILGKAMHDNVAATLMKALTRRMAGSSGLREQFRQQAFQQYGEDASWLTRAAGSAAPFAVDVMTGGFALPSLAGKGAVKGVTNWVARNAAKKITERAAGEVTKDAAREMSAATLSRYLQTNAPVMNVLINSVGGAANFGSYEMQNEMIRQFGNDEFEPMQLLKAFGHGAALGGVMGVAGGSLGALTQGAGVAGKVAGDVAGVAAETGIFATDRALEKAREDGVSILDVDWADIAGESLGMVLGMKTVGGLMSPNTLRERYSKSPEYDLKLDERNRKELEDAGYNFNNIFKGMEEVGKMAPLTLTKAKELGVQNEPRKIGEEDKVEVNGRVLDDMMKNPSISSDTKRKVLYLVTGKILAPERVFNAEMNINEDGSATIITTNVAGDVISVKDYDDVRDADKVYQERKAEAKANTLYGLNLIFEQFGIVDEMESRAKRLTNEEVGIDIDDVLSKRETERSGSEKAAVDAYIKNLQESFMEWNNANMIRIAADDAVRQGRKMQTPEEIHDSERMTEEAGAQLDEDTKRVLDEMWENGVRDENSSQLADIFNENPAARNYFVGLGQRRGVDLQVNDNVAAAVAAERERLMPYTKMDGLGRNYFVPAVMEGREGYVMEESEDGEEVMVQFEDSEKPEMVLKSNEDLQIGEPVLLDEHLAEFETQMSETMNAEVENARVNHPLTKLEPVPGETIDTMDGKKRVAAVNDNGIFLEEPVMVLDEETGQMMPKHQNEFRPEDAVSLEEFVQKQNEYYDGMEQQEREKTRMRQQAENYEPVEAVDYEQEEKKDEMPVQGFDASEVKLVSENAAPADYEAAEGYEGGYDEGVNVDWREEQAKAERKKADDELVGRLMEKDEKTSSKFIKNNLDKIEKDLKKARNKESDATDFDQFEKETAQYEAEVKRLEAEKARWEEIQKRVKEERAAAAKEEEGLPELATKVSQLGEPFSMKEWVMRALHGGDYKFIWADSPTTKTRGLGSHLGFADSNTEFRKRLGLLANREKGGLYPEEVAEKLMSAYAAEMGWKGTDGDWNVSSQDMFNMMLDVLREYSIRGDIGKGAVELHNHALEASRMKAQSAVDAEEEYMKDEWAKDGGFSSYAEYENWLEMKENELEPFTEEEYNVIKSQIVENYEEKSLSLQQNEELNTEDNGQGEISEASTGDSGSNGLRTEQGIDQAGGIEGSAGEQRENEGVRGEGTGTVREAQGESGEVAGQTGEPSGANKSSIQGLENYSEDEILGMVRDFFESVVADAGADAEVVDMKIVGSRANGDADADSDLDVLVEYKGNAREDGLFNMLAGADEPLVIDGIKVDINPITKGKSGTIAEWMKRNEGYKKEVEKKQEPLSETDPLKRAEQIEAQNEPASGYNNKPLTQYEAYEREQDTVDKQGGLVKNELADRILSPDWRGALHVLGRNIGRRIVVLSGEDTRRRYGKGVRGFYDHSDNTLYLNEDYAKDNEELRNFVLGHEFTHILRKENPEVWRAFADTVRMAMGEEFQRQFDKKRNLYDTFIDKYNATHTKKLPRLRDDQIEEEVCADWSGQNVLTDEEAVKRIIENAEQAGADPVSLTKKILDTIKQWLSQLKQALKNAVGSKKEILDNIRFAEKAKNLWQDMYNVAVAKQNAKLSKENLDKYDPIRRAEQIENKKVENQAKLSLEDVNERFNEQLSKFTIKNADKNIFDLGFPSEALLAAGVENKPIRLYGSKVAAKMKKHGFSSSELQNLPSAVAQPIAIFDNLGRNGNRSVLTELKTANGNFLVTIDLGKGADADFDVVSSVLGKRGSSVVNWINNGLLKYVDKEKALNYLHLSAPIAEASNNTELVSAAKVIQEFENPKLSGKKNVEEPKFSLADKENRDKEYDNAVSEGDMEKALRAVEAAAKMAMPNTKVVDENGEPKVVYHGSKLQEFYYKDGNPYTRWIDRFNVFNEGKGYFTDNETDARNVGRGKTGLYSCYLNIKKPFVFDAKGARWDEIEFNGKKYQTTDSVVRWAKEHGEYDGVIIKNVIEPETQNPEPITDYVAFSPNQIKSAGIEYDDNGNLIPLSERFSENDDIRFSLDDGVGERELAPNGKNYMNPRDAVPKVRGGWNERKIKEYLKHHPTRSGVRTAARAITEFNSPEELKEHMFYHGSAFGSDNLKPSITMSDRDLERYGGGGYGDKYWGISVSKDKKIASRFSGTSSNVRIYPIILLKGAKVIERPDFTDAYDAGEHITELWDDGVDAVWIGEGKRGKGEQELLILNPRAVVNIGTPDFYRQYRLGYPENPLRIANDEAINRMYETAKRFVEYSKPSKPKKPSRFIWENNELKKDEKGNLVYKTDEQYNAEMEEYNRQMEEYEKSSELRDYREMESKANSDIRFSLDDEEKTLMGVHNISEEKLRKALKVGGLANPSMAVLDTDNYTHTDYGEISLIPRSSLIDARTGRNAGTFTADAWTPTYPPVQKRMTNKGQDQFWKDMHILDDEPRELYSKTRMAFDSWLDGRNTPERLAFWFLKEKGIEPERVYNESGIPAEEKKAFKDIVGDTERDFYELTPEEREKVLPLIAKSRGETVEEMLEKFQQLKKRNQELLQSDPKFKVIKQRAIESIDEYGITLGAARDYFDKMRSAFRYDGTINDNATISAAVDQVKKHGLEKEFDQWIADKEKKYGIEEWLWNGTDYQGRDRWLRNTLENASKLMKRQGLNGAKNWSSIGNWIAKVANKEKTLEGIRKYKGNLSKSLEEHEAFQDKWTEILHDIALKIAYNGDILSGENIMSDALEHKNPADYIKKEYGVDLSKEDRQMLDTFIKEVRENFPTGYFETKFERPVGLDEFAVAVVPENTSPEVVEALRNAGLDVRTYNNEGTEEENNEARRAAVMDAVSGRDDILFSLADEEPFYSNAEKAVENIKQEKATPEQWLKMIEKNGGLKAGEDKWMGLSDWLKGSDAKTLTKSEVLDYIRKNEIQIEEVNYGELNNVDDNEKMKELKEEFAQIQGELTSEKENLEREIAEFDEEMYEKYGEGWYNQLTGKEREYADAIENRYRNLDDSDDAAFREMVSRYGDDFEQGFEVVGGELEPVNDYYEGISDAARYYLDIDDKAINETRLNYTTEGLDNKREIALVVPSVEPYNENDEIHFGDAGEGRAVAWVRFGETLAPRKEKIYKVVEEFDAPYKSASGLDIYYPKGEKYAGKQDYIAYGKTKDGNMSYVPVVNGEQIAAFDTFDEAKDAMNAQYREKNIGETQYDKVLVIDEIQSKRHQEGREKGYESEFADSPKGKYDEAYEKLTAYRKELEKKYGENFLSDDMTEEERTKYNEMYDNMVALSEYKDDKIYNVPDAPFDKNWHELAMKRMLRYAAENGYDKVAWTKGEQQAERYNIGKAVRKINVQKVSSSGDEATYRVTTWGKEGNSIGTASGIMSQEQMTEVFGKDLASRMAEQADKSDDMVVMEGDGLMIGGEGMKGFYDQILPRFMDKYGKKWGVKTGEVELPQLEESAQKMWSVDVTPEMKESVMQGQPMFSLADEPLDEYDPVRRAEQIEEREKKQRIEKVRTRFNELNRKYNGVDFDTIVLDELSDDELIDVLGVKGEEREEIKNDIDKVRKHFSNPKRLAVFNPFTGRIIIFADRIKQGREDEAYFHENIHKILEDWYGDGLRSIAERFWDVAPDEGLVSKQHVIDKYKPEDRKEDLFTFWLSRAMVNGDVGIVLDMLNDEDKMRVNNILNILGYDRKAEEIVRKKESDREGFSQQSRQVQQGGALHGGRGAEAEVEAPKFSLDEGESEEVLGFDNILTKATLETAESNKENLQQKVEAVQHVVEQLEEKMRRIRDGVKEAPVAKGAVGSAVRAQKYYDRSTVNDFVEFAKVVMDAGMMDNASKGEVKRLLNLTKGVATKEQIEASLNAVADLIIDHSLRECKEMLNKQLSTKGKKVDAKGVEVQGKLDVEGQRVLSALKDGMKLDEESLANRMADALDRMGDADDAVSSAAVAEYQGLQLAEQYLNNIAKSEAEEAELKHEYQIMKDNAKRDVPTIDRESFKQFEEEYREVLRQMRMERVEAYQNLVYAIGGDLAQSFERAQELREAEKERVRAIQHNANSDMQGVPATTQNKLPWTKKLANNSLLRFFMQPLATFDEMLTYLGKKSPDGRGYLWNRFMTQWTEAADKEWKNLHAAHQTLDEKVHEIFPNLNRWSDLFTLERKMPGADVSYWDADGKHTYHLTAGNLLYIYMVNKMSDGRMKLRRMGIDEGDVEEIKESLDPRLIELADWIQNEFLVQKRNDYNAVHQRMFGADMAAIEDYFPLKIDKKALPKTEDLTAYESSIETPSTITGSVIKRTKNAAALDLVNADAFDVVLDHLQQMEHWAAFAEFNRDLNTLLSYKHFKNQLRNMSSVRFGAGETLLDNFKKVAAIAGGAYRPKVSNDSVDKTLVNMAKGVTAAKIAIRVYTAFKQLLSYPAYLSEANLVELAKSSTPWGAYQACNWAMENLPLFAERWQSRQAGDTRLQETDSDWDVWKTAVVKAAARWGMTPNAAVDALTVAMGARAIYQTALKRYKKTGFDDEVAEQKALRDAAIAYNETQQSSQGAFVSAVQLDRTAAAAAISVFRNASMAYQRRMLRALAQMKYRAQSDKEDSIGFASKLLEREGLDEEQAEKAAKRIYQRSVWRNLADVAIFGYVLQWFWNLAPYVPYLLAGDDDDEKKKMLEDVSLHSFLGGIEGLSGGNYMSEFLNYGIQALMAEDDTELNKVKQKARYQDMNLLPLMSDIKDLMDKTLQGDSSAFDMGFNLIMQSAVGVNPQTIADGIAAVIDAFNGDMGTFKEFAFALARIMQAPSGSMDLLYIDELGMFAHDARKLRMEDLAKRWAKYKFRKDHPYTGWMLSEESKKALEDKYVNRFEDKVKDRLSDMDDEEVERMMIQSRPGMEQSLLEKEMKKRYQKKTEELEGEELEKAYDEAELLPERKVLAKDISKEAGASKDPYGDKPDKEYERIYQDLRSADDVREDALLLAEQEKAKNDGDEERKEYISKQRSNVMSARKGLGRGRDEEVMKQLRENRKKLMDKLGVKDE